MSVVSIATYYYNLLVNQKCKCTNSILSSLNARWLSKDNEWFHFTCIILLTTSPVHGHWRVDPRPTVRAETILFDFNAKGQLKMFIFSSGTGGRDSRGKF